MPPRPLDVLSQQIVAEIAAREMSEDEMFALVRRAWPYRTLERKDFDAVVRMLAEGFSTRRGIRAGYLHRDAVHKRLRGRKGGRPQVLDKDKRDLAVRLYQEKKTPIARICTMLGISKPTLYAYVRAAEAAGEGR